jgi:predicted ATPase
VRYLESFALPDQGSELAFLSRDSENKRTCYTSRYPFGVFLSKEVPTLEFEPVTIFCGGNGSGKTTLLNLIGEKLGISRGAIFNRSSFFSKYLALCRADCTTAFNERVREKSRVITSDDVFDFLLDFRYMNEGIANRRQELLEEYADARYAKFQLHSLEDVDRLRQVVEAQRRTGSQYVRNRLMQDIPGKSNGESAFLYFTREIQDGGLYLLDEPENSLAPNLQEELVQFISDSARFYRCQFVISTHSIFLLSMRGARIYNLDADPVQQQVWTQLDHVQAYYRFFQEKKREFDKDQ